MGKTGSPKGHILMIMLLDTVKDSADIIKVHNQLASSLQQKECRKPFHQSYLNINLPTKQLPIHLPARQELDHTTHSSHIVGDKITSRKLKTGQILCFTHSEESYSELPLCLLYHQTSFKNE